jgi:hypothetical protein
MDFNHDDPDRAALMRQVWEGTPWMVDAFTDGTGSGRDREMRDWCREQFGPEAWPIHGRPGQWQRGSATINGWTWFGFATKAQMDQFIARWPQPARPH